MGKLAEIKTKENMCIRTDARGLDLGYFVCGYTSTDDCQQSTAHSIGT
ncbi:hypothetical protein SAMN03080617_02618 [Algoriphagus alkaliphilus]|uniref:Uncharacterized protein n=1 Tax=Algoriphagus alkaliphilus TaxID=279824 RepID=A0A1G5YJZ9_9BACT|nr:hypothetical protein SAMN03080617_02618 [Algoriphagus alkaliphilus]